MTYYSNIDKELSELSENSQAYLSQMKENILSMIREKLEDFENQFAKYLINYMHNREMLSQLAHFKGLHGDQDIKESYDNLKYQLRSKIEKLKQLHDQIDVFQLSSKLIRLDPMQEQPKRLNLDRFNPEANNLDLEQSESDTKKDGSRKLINYNCPFCKKRLTSSYGARTHIRFFHGIEQHLFCPHLSCSFAAGQSNDLARHLIASHGFPYDRKNLHRYKCFYTGEMFKSKTELQYHIASYQGYLNPPAHYQAKQNAKNEELIGLE